MRNSSMTAKKMRQKSDSQCPECGKVGRHIKSKYDQYICENPDCMQIMWDSRV